MNARGLFCYLCARQPLIESYGPHQVREFEVSKQCVQDELLAVHVYRKQGHVAPVSPLCLCQPQGCSLRPQCKLMYTPCVTDTRVVTGRSRVRCSRVNLLTSKTPRMHM